MMRYLRQLFFINPYEWWDNKRIKMYPMQPDIKHKDTSEAPWLHSDTMDWITRRLELLDLRKRYYDEEKHVLAVFVIGSRTRCSWDSINVLHHFMFTFFFFFFFFWITKRFSAETCNTPETKRE